MKKQEILELICDKLPAYLTEYDIESVSICNNMRNNGVSLQGIQICVSGKNVAPCIYIDGYLPRPDKSGEYDEEKLDIDGILRSMADEFGYAIGHFEPDEAGLYEWEDVKQKLILVLVSFEQNENMLSDCPYILFHDLAVTFRVSVLCGSRIGSFVVSNKMAEYWGVTTKELWKHALANSMRLLPPVIERLDQAIKKMMKLPEEAGILPDSPFYIITNEKGMFGAAALLYDGLLKRMAEMLEESFYILPSSIHEVLVVPENLCGDPAILKDMVRNVNGEFTDKSEILSYSVYFYDKKEDCIRVITA